MEFLTGYRAELLDLVALVLGWRRGVGGGPGGTPPNPEPLRRLPPEPGPWLLHVLPNTRLGVALPLGGGAARRGGGDPRGPLCGDTALTLQDLRRTLTFISLEEEEEEGEGGGAPPGQLLVLTRLLLLTDARGFPLGLDFELGSPRTPPGPPPTRRALALLCRSMGCPMAGGPPRRPRHLSVGDADLRASLQPLAARFGVTLVGTQLRDWGPPPILGPPALRSRLCHACGGLAGTPLPCPQCRAVLYCSEGCRAAEAFGVHRGWCRQLGGFMGRAGALAQLPFTFTADLPFVGLQPAGEVALPPAPPEPPPESCFRSWQQYYSWRGLPLSSPLAALLSYPLSLYYVITSLAPRHFPELNILRKRSLRVQLEESGRELQLVGVFWELSVLLPHLSLELLFLGGSVPPPMDGRRFLLQRTVGGGKSGAQRVPAYFAEGGEYGCAVAGAAVGAATGGGTGPPLLNPFRCPFRRGGLDNALPWLPGPSIGYQGPSAGMAHGGLQVLGLGLALAGWGALVAATALPQWQVSSFAGDSIITAVATYQGLWMSCASQSTGQLQCKSFDSILALPAHLQATRALMVVAGVLGPLALAVAVAGMKCTRCGDDDPRRKAGTAAAGGGLFLLCGMVGLVACSWYGHRIVTNFYDSTVPVNLK
ncbi:zinc finger MYND domain-containing protein 15 [Grus japonensis]|uniref:Zinc finger MYND domain-containing protein 15 n=1 Tax=Grus japonensis TaxID=30415 RepID=A0ABC9XTY4_GRUJA